MARKPVNTAQLSIRIPQQMKDKLQESAEKQGNDRSVMEEMLDEKKRGKE